MTRILRGIKRCKELYAIIKEEKDGTEHLCCIKVLEQNYLQLAACSKFELSKILNLDPIFVEETKKTHRIKLVKFESRKLVQYY